MAKRIGPGDKTNATHKERTAKGRKLAQALCQICRSGFDVGDVGIELDGNGNFHRACFQAVLMESFDTIPLKGHEVPGVTSDDLLDYYRNQLIEKGYTVAARPNEQAVPLQGH